jgi:hypothetical protein
MGVADIAVAWNWEHDASFVADLEREVRGLGRTFRSVTPDDVQAWIGAAESGAVRWKVLLDRAWESDPRFLRLNELAGAAGTRLVNAPARSARMGNKPVAHAALAGAGIGVPRLVEFAPAGYGRERLSAATAGWKRPFWMKPAIGGGGDGVVPVDEWPERFPLGPEWTGERFVGQEDAAPMTLAGRPAWFRVFAVFGAVYAFWWHPRTHVFTAVTEADRAGGELDCVERTAEAVAGVAGLEFFSCEISLTAPARPLVVDPVNDPADLRRASEAKGAIPDAALREMVARMARGLASIC